MKAIHKNTVDSIVAMLASVNIEELRLELFGRAIQFWLDCDIDYLKNEDINFSEVTGELGWPDWQDNGLFETAIKAARVATLAQRAYVVYGEGPENMYKV